MIQLSLDLRPPLPDTAGHSLDRIPNPFANEPAHLRFPRSCGYRLDGRYAGSIGHYENGTYKVHVNYGYIPLDKTGGISNRSRTIRDYHPTSLEDAERRLLAEALLARADPTLIWNYHLTKADWKIARANGWPEKQP